MTTDEFQNLKNYKFLYRCFRNYLGKNRESISTKTYFIHCIGDRCFIRDNQTGTNINESLYRIQQYYDISEINAKVEFFKKNYNSMKIPEKFYKSIIEHII